MIKQLQEGIKFVIEGFELAKKPNIRPYMIVPLIVNIILFSACGYLAIGQLDDLLSYIDFNTDLPGWLDWLEPIIAWIGGALYWILLVLGILLLLFIMSSIFTMVTHILVSPFLGILAEKVEKEIHEIDYPQLTVMQIAGRTFKRELVKLKYWGFKALGLALLTLVLMGIGMIFPPLQGISPILWYLFSAWMLAMQYLDIPADNNGIEFQETLAMMRKDRAATMGFGGAVTLATATPILNLIIIPIAVAGGVAFWVARMDQKKPSS